jgi:hypothetical protein
MVEVLGCDDCRLDASVGTSRAKIVSASRR